MSRTTPSQTVGPFPHEAWAWAVQASTCSGTPALRIRGQLLDGLGAPVNDGWLEAVYPSPSAGDLPGFQRVPTDDAGGFTLSLPCRPKPGEPAACLTVFARGLLSHQVTAVFLGDDDSLSSSALLNAVPADRRDTLLAQSDGGDCYRWVLRLQGGAGPETVFFDYA